VVPPDATREFAIGDRVQIKNPGRYQASGGTIAKIGANRITVRTASGSKILRAPKNLLLTNNE
jgi:small-conductance mechanosensitive channel